MHWIQNVWPFNLPPEANSSMICQNVSMGHKGKNKIKYRFEFTITHRFGTGPRIESDTTEKVVGADSDGESK